MFYLGVVLVVIGALAGYLPQLVAKVFRLTNQNQILWVKAAGLIFVLMGAILLFTNEFPKELQFLRFDIDIKFFRRE